MGEAQFRTAEKALWDSVGVDHPKEHFIDLKRIGTRVRVQEAGQGEAVLFIHGGPNSGSTWAQLVAEMDGFRCLILDRPGTGLSDDYSLAKQDHAIYTSSLVADVLDALDIERSHVVASSFGGYCALLSAVATPERFDRMVQMAAPALLPEQPLPQFMKAIMLPGVRKVIAALPPSRRSQESIMRQLGHGASIDAGKLSKAHETWYLALTQHTNTMRNEFDMIYGIKAKGGFDQSLAIGGDVLSEVVVPTHYLWGADDTFGDESVARWVVETMPHASLEMIPNSGHLPWIDDPAYIGKETVRFLRGES